ncbi:MAG: glycosyltransferase, partial [Bacteroidota bacterium]
MELPEKNIIVSVTSDLVTDQRVHRTALTLREQGAKVMLVGRLKKSSLPMSSRAYHFKRFRLPFETGPLFYAAYNIRLFFFLLSAKADLLVANDLDTLPANFLASRLKKIPLIYDSHEYFTEVPELVGRPRVQRIWKSIERRIFPRLSHVITVNESIAELYRKEYGLRVAVVRNLPMADLFEEDSAHQQSTRLEFGIPDSPFVFLLQGAGINVQRGAEEAVEAMRWVENAVLLIVGSGDVITELRQRARSPGLEGKVLFLPKLPMQDLKRVTRLADAGLTLDKDTNLNYRFSLPNKLFDYIQAGLP